ncbi:MAG: polymorphic toxin type 50 domain-containing protein, partial [Lachnospiraceae bacterium]
TNALINTVDDNATAYKSLLGEMSDADLEKYGKYLKNGSNAGLTQTEINAIEKLDNQIVLNTINYDEILKLRNQSNISILSEGGVDDLNLKINIGQQNKHIPGTNNYKQELANGKLKSILSADPQQLLDDFAGTGQKIGTNKERVDFGNVIGKYVNPETGEAVDTTVGIIHYGKNGAHIVPARPK